MIPATTLTNAQDTLEWPELALVGPRRYELLSDYVVEWEKEGFPRQRLVVPRGFECDGASVPAVLEWYLGRDKILPAAVPHDWQYAYAGRIPTESHLALGDDGIWRPADHIWLRSESDRFFARNLKFSEITSNQRKSAYWAVRIGGYFAWKKAERRRAVPVMRTA